MVKAKIRHTRTIVDVYYDQKDHYWKYRKNNQIVEDDLVFPNDFGGLHENVVASVLGGLFAQNDTKNPEKARDMISHAIAVADLTCSFLEQRRLEKWKEWEESNEA